MKAASVVFLCAFMHSAPAVTRVWDGGGGTASFSTAANWNPNGAPANGDDLVLGASAPATVTNDLVGRTFGNLTIQRSLTLAGNGFSLTGGLSSTPAVLGGPVVVSANVTLAASQTFLSSGGALSSLTFAGGVAFGANTLTLTGTRALTFEGLTGSSTAGSRLVKTSTGVARLGPSAILVTNQPFELTTGTLDVDGFFQTALNMIGGTLTGTGNLGSGLEASAGDIVPDEGDLDVTGPTVLGGTTVLRVRLLGPSDETQLACGGTVTLKEQATLDVATSGYTPVRGDGFLVLGKSPASPISGTFLNVPEASEIPVGTSVVRASYLGGNGNDLFLTTSSTTRTWDGDAVLNDNWTDAANWTGDIAPLFGDVLVFPSGIGSTDRGLDNDFPNDTTFRRLIFNGDDFTVRGSRFRLTHGLVVPENVTTHLDTTVALGAGSNQFFVVDGKLELDVLDRIDTAGRQLSLAGRGLVLGEITGAGDVFIRGQTELENASVTWRQAHSYTGDTLIEFGSTLILEKLSSLNPDPTLGGGAAGTTVRGRLSLANNQLVGALVLTENLLLDGGDLLLGAIDSNGLTTSGTNRIAGTITLRDDTFNEVVTQGLASSGSGAQEISGRIQGNGNLSFELDGAAESRTTLNGSQSNTFTGRLGIGSGRLILEKSASGVLAVSGSELQITAPNEGNTEVETRQHEQIADTCIVTVARQSRLNIGNLTARTETIGGLRLISQPGIAIPSVGGAANSVLVLNGSLFKSGPLPTTVSVALRVTQAATVFEIAEDRCLFEDPINRTAGASILKTGPGDMVVRSAAAVPMEAREGVLEFRDNDEGDGASSPVTLNGGILAGDGRSGALTSLPGGGRIQPQGVLSSGLINLNASTHLDIEVLNSTTGSGFDQLAANGIVTLNAATLNLTYRAGFNVAVGQSIFPLLNDGTDAIAGTFAGLPQGAFIPVPAGGGWVISYTGGTGNDVALTRVAGPPVSAQLNSLTLLPGAGPGGQDTVQVSGTAGPGTAATLQASNDLIGWTDAVSTTANGSGALNFSLNQSPSLARRFFRLKP